MMCSNMNKYYLQNHNSVAVYEDILSEVVKTKPHRRDKTDADNNVSTVPRQSTDCKAIIESRHLVTIVNIK